MNKFWQNLLAFLCMMALVLTCLTGFSFAEQETPDADTASAEEHISEETTEQTPPLPEEIQADPEPVEEPGKDTATEVPVVTAAPTEEPAVHTAEPTAVPTPAQEEEKQTPVPAAEEDFIPEVSDEPVPADESSSTEAPAQEENPEAKPDQEEAVQTDSVPAEEIPAEIVPANEVPVTEPFVSPETKNEAPATEIPAEVNVPEENPVKEQIAADLTLKTLQKGSGVVTGGKYIIRLISNVTGKVKVTIDAPSDLLVAFGEDGKEPSRETLTNDEGKLTFNFNAVYDHSYLLYVYSIEKDIQSVPFQIITEKAEPATASSETQSLPTEAPEEVSSVEETPEATDGEPAETEETRTETDEAEDNKTIEQVQDAETEKEAAEEILSDQTEPSVPTINVRRVVITTDDAKYHEGDTVHLNAAMEGFEDIEDFLIIWDVDKGEGWEEVARGQNNFYTFPASAETLSWTYRVRVFYK